MTNVLKTSKLRLRMSMHDAHYAGNLVDGARMLALFGDVATELLIQQDGDEGLFKAYDNVEFCAPVYAGDYIEVVGNLLATGKTSRKMEFFAYKVIQLTGKPHVSSAEILKEPILVCKASGTCVTPLEMQTKK